MLPWVYVTESEQPPLNESDKLLKIEELMIAAARRHPIPTESLLLYGFFLINRQVALSTATEK